MTTPRVHCRSFVQGLQIIPNVITGNELPQLIRQSSFFEQWQMSCTIVSNGENPFLGLSRDSGWRFTFLQLLPSFTEVEEITFDSEDEGEDAGDGAYDTVILPPTWTLRAFIVREDMIAGRGLYSYHYLATPNGGRWHTELLQVFHNS